MQKSLLSIGITSIHFAGSPTAGINVVRSLRESSLGDVELIALTNYPLSSAMGMQPDIKEVYMIPFTSQGPRAILKRLEEIVLQRPLHLLIPCNDEEVLIVSQIQNDLRNLGIQTLLPSAETVLSVTKARLYETGCRLSLPVAKSRTSKSLKILQGGGLDFPVVIKGVLCDAYLAKDKKEVGVYFRKIQDVWGLPVIFQEFVDGDEYAVVCLADRCNRIEGAIAIRKIGVTEKGKTWCGCTIDDPTLLSLAKEVVEKLGWVGPMEIEVIRDGGTGKYKIIEINPRFPAWIYLATAAGQNLPEALVRIALGHELCSLPAYRTGVIFTRICHYATYPVTLLGHLTMDGHADLELLSRTLEQVSKCSCQTL